MARTLDSDAWPPAPFLVILPSGDSREAGAAEREPQEEAGMLASSCTTFRRTAAASAFAPDNCARDPCFRVQSK